MMDMSFDNSDRPSKRRKTDLLDAEDRGGYSENVSECEFEDRAELEQEQWHNQDRFRHRMEDIFEKYSAIQVDDGDEINIRTGAIEVDRGHLKTLPNADYEDDCESFTSEEDGIMEDHDEDILDFLQDPVYKAPDWSNEPPTKPRSQLPNSWTLHDDLRPLSNVLERDLPSDETILRQFGSAGPAVLEVLKKQITDKAFSSLPTPEETQTSGTESHEDDDLSILPHFPAITTSLKFVRTPRADLHKLSVVASRPALPPSVPSASIRKAHGSISKGVIEPTKSHGFIRTGRHNASGVEPSDMRQEEKHEQRRRSQGNTHEKYAYDDNYAMGIASQSTPKQGNSRVNSDSKVIPPCHNVCPSCQKEFRTKRYLAIHEAKVCKKSTILLACPLGCKKSYQHTSGLRKHLEYFCPHPFPGKLNSGQDPMPIALDRPASYHSPEAVFLNSHHEDNAAHQLPDLDSTAPAAVINESMVDEQEGSSLCSGRNTSTEARRSRLSLRPLTRQPDYRIRKSMKDFLRSAAFSAQPPAPKFPRWKAYVRPSKIVKLKVNFAHVDLVKDTMNCSGYESQPISAWQKQPDTDSEDEIDAVSGWQKNYREDTPSDAGICESLNNQAIFREEPPSWCYTAQWNGSFYNCATPCSQMPTPPPDREDLVLPPIRDRFPSERGRSTAFLELVMNHDGSDNTEEAIRNTVCNTREVLDSDADSGLMKSSQPSTHISSHF